MAQAKKKKRFFNIDLPLIRRSTQLQAFAPKELDGRFVKYDLTRVMKGKSLMITFKLKVDGEEATSLPKEVKIMPYFLRRVVRKGTDYVEDSFSTPCKNAQLRIKPFLVTRRRVSRRVRKALRNLAREELTNYVKDKDFETLFDELLKNKIQKPLSLKLKKIYPLSTCEIRVLKVEKFPEEIEK